MPAEKVKEKSKKPETRAAPIKLVKEIENLI